MSALYILAKNPVGSCSYLLLILAMTSQWLYKHIWFWGSCFIGSYVAAYYGDIATLKTLIPVGILFLCHLCIKEEIGGFARFFAAIIAAIISIALMTHFIGGFHNICLYSKWKSSANALPMNIYLNFDKAIVPLFILGLYTPLIQTKEEFRRVVAYSFAWFLLLASLLLGLSYYFGIIAFDFKLPLITPIWLIYQLFFVVIPEEAFYRGFIQREISINLPNKGAPFLAILVTSLLFTAQHLFFILDPYYLVLVFLSSLFYGAVYQFTQMIECAILVHLAINITHFFFFSYPMLEIAIK